MDLGPHVKDFIANGLHVLEALTFMAFFCWVVSHLYRMFK